MMNELIQKIGEKTNLNIHLGGMKLIFVSELHLLLHRGTNHPPYQAALLWLAYSSGTVLHVQPEG